MFNLFNRNCQSRVDRFEEAFIRTTNLLERGTVVQEQQQTSIEQSFRHIDQLYEEIRGLRTESLRIQRHIFGDEVDGN